MHSHTSPVARDPHDIPLRSALHDAFPTQIDQYICPQCESDIPLTHVLTSDYTDRTTRRKDKTRQAVVRRVQVMCPYCKAAFDSGQVLEMGAWKCAEIRRMTDAKEKSSLSRQIDQRLGTIRRPAVAA